MKTLKYITLSIALVTAFTSCKKDKEDPTITISAPGEHTEYAEGAMVHITAEFADDRDLASYTFMIGDVNGGHIHDFHIEEANDISGETYEFHKMVTVPDSIDIHMFYLHFTVIDAEGKSVSKKHMLHIE